MLPLFVPFCICRKAVCVPTGALGAPHELPLAWMPLSLTKFQLPLGGLYQKLPATFGVSKLVLATPLKPRPSIKTVLSAAVPATTNCTVWFPAVVILKLVV